MKLTRCCSMRDALRFVGVVVLAGLLGIPTALAGSHSESGSVSYKPGKGFTLSDATGDNVLRFTGHLQTRFEWDIREDPDIDDRYRFRVARARLKTTGNVFTRDFKFTLQMAMDNSNFALKDYNLTYVVNPDWFQVTAGQYKRPYTRQHLVSGTKFEFIERGLSHGFSEAGRDIGVMFHNGKPGEGLEYAFAILNGNTPDADAATFDVDSSKFTNFPDRFSPSLIGRVAYNYGGIKAYSEGDLEGGPFRFAVGGAFWTDLDADNTNDGFTRITLDAVAKMNGFAIAGAAFLNMVQTADSWSEQELVAMGGFLQLSYLVADFHLLGLRWHTVDPDDEVDDDGLHEATFVYNILMFGHNLKWQTEFSALLTETPDDPLVNYRVRSQLNFVW